jgi:hypothetical protein
MAQSRRPTGSAPAPLPTQTPRQGIFERIRQAAPIGALGSVSLPQSTSRIGDLPPQEVEQFVIHIQSDADGAVLTSHALAPPEAESTEAETPRDVSMRVAVLLQFLRSPSLPPGVSALLTNELRRLIRTMEDPFRGLALLRQLLQLSLPPAVCASLADELQSFMQGPALSSAIPSILSTHAHVLARTVAEAWRTRSMTMPQAITGESDPRYREIFEKAFVHSAHVAGLAVLSPGTSVPPAAQGEDSAAGPSRRLFAV